MLRCKSAGGPHEHSAADRQSPPSEDDSVASSRPPLGNRSRQWLAALGLTLLAAACGGSDEATQATATTIASTTSLATTTSSPPPTATTVTTTTTTTTAVPTTTTSIPELTTAEVYATNCAVCHGAELEGGVGPGLGAGGHAYGHADEELAAIIANGKNSMPAFADRLTERQITDLVTFIREADTSA